MARSWPQSHGDPISMENSLELSTTSCMSLPRATATRATTAAAAATTTANKSTVTTALLKWKSKLWRRWFRWDQFKTTSVFSFVDLHAFFSDKSVQVKVINFIKYEQTLFGKPLTKILYLMYLQIWFYLDICKEKTFLSRSPHCDGNSYADKLKNPHMRKNQQKVKNQHAGNRSLMKCRQTYKLV